MAQSDCASVGIDAVGIDSGFLDDGEGLGGKSFVQFDDVDVGEL